MEAKFEIKRPKEQSCLKLSEVVVVVVVQNENTNRKQEYYLSRPIHKSGLTVLNGGKGVRKDG